MPALSLVPAFSLFAAIHRISPVRPIRTLLRTAEEKFSPSQARIIKPTVRTAQARLLESGAAGPHQFATLLTESGKGSTPTIVLGGFVPDSTEQVFLLRRFFLRSGDIFYLNYPRDGFSLDVMCAQLDDLVSEINARGQAPVIFSVSFGSGILMEWLLRSRRAGREASVSGVVLVSPVACSADVMSPTATKPSTLLGRALRPYYDAKSGCNLPVEKSRQIFSRMFEAGAQNKQALATLMTSSELTNLRGAVMATIRNITSEGAHQRVQALRGFASPTDYFSQALLPLTKAPVLVLFADHEEAVIEPDSPTRFAMDSAHRAYFPNGRVVRVTNRFGPPVQHASLIFHVFDYLPSITSFYNRLKTKKRKAAKLKAAA